ncbi:unnamed protein product [Durusdinium trenchii]|uniref:PAS domain-containing protein n=2 Tax=Durusdinium trenchii TaxID=1381693 RepID=A0ABP0L560_9DINO
MSALPSEAAIFIGLAGGVQVLFLWSTCSFLVRHLAEIRRFGAFLREACTRARANVNGQSTADDFEELVLHEMQRRRSRLAGGLIGMYAVVCCGFMLTFQLRVEEDWLPMISWGCLAHASCLTLCLWIPALMKWDLFYVLFCWSCLFYLSPLVSEPLQYLEISWAFLLVLRIPLAIIPRKILSPFLCNLGFWLMLLARLLMDDWSLAESLTTGLVAMELVGSLLVMGAALLVDAFLRTSAKQDLQTGGFSQLSQQLNAATSLLHLACDAVVELDANLRLTKHSPELAAMLLRDFQGASLAGMGLTDLMPDRDAARAMTHLVDFRSTSSSSQQPTSLRKSAHAFQSRLVDSGATKISVEIFQVMYRPVGGETCHLVGIKDITDTQAQAPSVSEGSESGHHLQDQFSGSGRSPEWERSQQARVCLDLDVDLLTVVAATAPLTEVVGKSLRTLFPQNICMLMQRISQEGRLFLERNEPLPSRAFSFDELPLKLDEKTETISGHMQLAKNATEQVHVLMFFHCTGPDPRHSSRSTSRSISPLSPRTPLSTGSLSPVSPMSPRSSQRVSRRRERSDSRERRSGSAAEGVSRGSGRMLQL